MAYTNNLHIIYGDATLGINTQISNIFSAMKKVA